MKTNVGDVEKDVDELVVEFLVFVTREREDDAEMREESVPDCERGSKVSVVVHE